MSISRFKISSKNLPQGYTTIPARVVMRSNRRIQEEMKAMVKDVQRKKMLSLDKASKIILAG